MLVLGFGLQKDEKSKQNILVLGILSDVARSVVVDEMEGKNEVPG
jgi:hypothetical protein